MDEKFLDEIWARLLDYYNSQNCDPKKVITEVIEFYHRPKYQYPRWLIEQLEQDLSIKAMAKRANCHPKTIRSYLKKFDLNHENYEQRRDALLPSPPFVKKRKKKRRDRKREAALKTAIKLKGEGWSLRQIAAVLNSVPMTSLKNKKLWHPETVRRLLKDQKSKK